MRILQVIPYFPPAYAFGGPVQVAYQISKELAKRGHEITVYTTDAKNLDSRLVLKKDVKNVNGKIRIYYMKNLTMMSVKKAKLFITPKIISVVKREIRDFDIIHLHEYRTFQNIVIHHYARKCNIPYILQAHGSVPRIGSWRRLKQIYDISFGYRCLKDASKLIALNKAESMQYKNMGISENKIAIIPNGIDLSKYANLPSRNLFKEKFNIAREKKIILYLGRINRIKGLDFLIKTYAYLTRKMNYKDIILVIAGPDDGYLCKAKYLVKKLNISKSVIFTGPLYGYDKLAAYVDSVVYVLPSRYECFPITILEAYACKKPVIVSNIESLKNLVIDNKTGFFFEIGNFNQLAQKIFYLLNNEDKAIEMGKEARRIVEKMYSIERVTDRLEKLYRKAVFN